MTRVPCAARWPQPLYDMRDIQKKKKKKTIVYRPKWVARLRSLILRDDACAVCSAMASATPTSAVLSTADLTGIDASRNATF